MLLIYLEMQVENIWKNMAQNPNISQKLHGKTTSTPSITLMPNSELSILLNKFRNLR
jgi:hypothetical protein